MSIRGLFAIGIYRPKTETNVGTLWRSAHQFGAAFIFTVGRRYRRQPSDTTQAAQHLPLMHFTDVQDLQAHLPHGAPLIGIELCPRARMLGTYTHPASAVYLLGAEDNGLPDDVIGMCHSMIEIENAGTKSFNVAVAGSIVMWHRHMQRTKI